MHARGWVIGVASILTLALASAAAARTDTEDHLALIWKDLGIHGFVGTLCDNV